MSLVRER
ncbi:hypothetical protein LINPERHAP2_LOCUS19339 [Linum perenne]